MKKRPGKLWFKFRLFGLDWETRLIPKGHRVLKDGKHDCMGMCFLSDRWIAVSADMTSEQRRITLAHELQHAIEDHADVDYEKGVPTEVHDRWTDMVARGWVYLMRENPKIVAYLRDD